MYRRRRDNRFFVIMIIKGDKTMKKIAVVLLSVIVLSMLFVSCSSTNNHGVALSQNKGVVGKNGIPRPDWVIYDQSNKKEHFATGYGTGMTFEVAKAKASLAADSELAMWISTTVEAVRDRYVEDNVVNTNETYLEKFVISATEAGRAVISGIIEVDYWEDAEGGVWVLKCIDVKNVKAQIESAIASTGTDTSLFAPTTDVDAVLAKLNAALDEYFPAE